MVALPEKSQIKLENRLSRILSPELMDMDLAFPSGGKMNHKYNYSQISMQPLDGDHYINLQLKLSFLDFFIDLFDDYRNYISFIRKYPEPVTIFNKAKYIKDRPDAIEFLTMFVETQAFTMFLEMHHQQSFSIFEEVIKLYHQGCPDNFILNRFFHHHFSSSSFPSLSSSLPSPSPSPSSSSLPGFPCKFIDFPSCNSIYSTQHLPTGFIQILNNYKIHQDSSSFSRSIFPTLRKDYFIKSHKYISQLSFLPSTRLYFLFSSPFYFLFSVFSLFPFSLYAFLTYFSLILSASISPSFLP